MSNLALNGLTLHQDSPRRLRLRSYSLSTSVFRLRLSGGVDVLSSIDIPIVQHTTAITRPDAHPKRHLLSNTPATRTHFRGREKSVDDTQTPTESSGLVFQHASKHCPSSMHHRLGKHASSHSLHVQIFEAHRLVLAGDPRRKFVQEILALIGNFGMLSSDFQSGTFSAIAPFLFSRQRPLEVTELFLSTSVMSRVSNLGTIRQGGEIGETQIDTHCCGSFRKGFWFYFNDKTDVIPTIAILCDNYRRWVRRKFPRPSDLQLANFSEIQFPRLSKSESALGKPGRLPRTFGFKAWKVDAFTLAFDASKGLFSSLVVKPKRLLQRDNADTRKPRSFLRSFRLGNQEFGQLDVSSMFSSRCSSIPSQCDRVVPDRPHASEKFRQGALLNRGRVHSVGVSKYAQSLHVCSAYPITHVHLLESCLWLRNDHHQLIYRSQIEIRDDGCHFENRGRFNFQTRRLQVQPKEPILIDHPPRRHLLPPPRLPLRLPHL